MSEETIQTSRRNLLKWSAVLAAGTVLGTAGPRAANGGMRTRRIPSSGEVLPVIGLGTWQTFDVGPDGKARGPVREVLARFVELGGRLVDSSPMYGRAEAVIGDLATELGVAGRLFHATKVWTTGREAGIRQMRRSAERMRADPIDLMQVHNLLDWRTHLATLQGWKAEGRVRYVGITHYRNDALDELTAIVEREPIDFVQMAYNIGNRAAERRLLPAARERGVAVIANRPFQEGALFRAVRGRPLPDWAQEIDCTSWAQVFLKFIVSHPGVTCTIPATSNPKHLVDNMQAGYGRLPDPPLRRRMAALFA